jgi:hypothetical protein
LGIQWGIQSGVQLVILSGFQSGMQSGIQPASSRASVVATRDQVSSVIARPPSLPWLRQATAVMEHAQPSECFTVKIYKMLGEEVPAAPEEAAELRMFDSVAGHAAVAVFAAVAITHYCHYY